MRIPYVPDPLPPDADAESVATASRMSARRAPRPLQPLDLALLHSPPVADGWNSFLGAVRTRTSLPADLRELAICRVAAVNGAAYEWAHHAPLARAAGVSSEAMARVVARHGALVAADADADASQDTALLDRRQWAVLRYADEMTRSVRVTNDTFALVRSLFSDREVVEITGTIACYNCVSRFLVALDVGESNALNIDAAAEGH